MPQTPPPIRDFQPGPAPAQAPKQQSGREYPGITALIAISKGLAILVATCALLSALMMFVNVADTAKYSEDQGLFLFALTLLTGGWLLFWAFVSIILWANAEILQIVVDIQDNTYRSRRR